MSHSSLFGSDDELEDFTETSIDGFEDENHEVSLDEGGIIIRPNDQAGILVAEYAAQKIKGFYLLRDLIPIELQELLLRRILEEKAVTAQHPQAMLFPRSSQFGSDLDNCPPYLSDLVEALSRLLRAHLPPEDLEAVFDENLPLQTIINMYEPGQGITPHVSQY